MSGISTSVSSPRLSKIGKEIKETEYYVVKPGDNWWTIARALKHELNAANPDLVKIVAALKRTNGIKENEIFASSSDLLQPNRKIKIPYTLLQDNGIGPWTLKPSKTLGDLIANSSKPDSEMAFSKNGKIGDYQFKEAVTLQSVTLPKGSKMGNSELKQDVMLVALPQANNKQPQQWLLLSPLILSSTGTNLKVGTVLKENLSIESGTQYIEPKHNPFR